MMISDYHRVDNDNEGADSLSDFYQAGGDWINTFMPTTTCCGIMMCLNCMHYAVYIGSLTLTSYGL